jgi:uncharacterized membrane protein YfcA
MIWLVLAGLVVAALLTQGEWRGIWAGGPVAGLLEPTTLLAIFVAALLCEYLDSSLGMGYGTTLTPLLLIAGFDAMAIVPAVLFSELLTGLAAGALHHRDGNIDLVRDRRALRTLLLLASLLAVRLSGPWLGYAIVAIVLAMGLVTLATARRRIRYRPAGILVIGLVASFNKGLSGGGYGPLVTAGQVVSGVPARHAVAITSLAEAFTCLVGLAGYLAVKGAPDWSLALPLAAGAMLSVPWATVTVRRLPETWLRAAVGTLTLILGAVSLAKLLA